MFTVPIKILDGGTPIDTPIRQSLENENKKSCDETVVQSRSIEEKPLERTIAVQPREQCINNQPIIRHQEINIDADGQSRPTASPRQQI